MKVRELIHALQQFDLDVDVKGTWEGQLRRLSVYRAADGCILVDADDDSYRLRFQEIPCTVCGKQSRSAPFMGKPVCYKHWQAFADGSNPETEDGSE